MAILNVKRYKTYFIFLNEIKRIQDFRKNDNKSGNQKILAVMFLHLTLESFITFCIRCAVEDVFYEDIRIRAIWRNDYENVQIEKKLNFFQNTFSPFGPMPQDWGKVKTFVKKSCENRNLIVHGHELATFQENDGEISGTKLYKKINLIDINKYYKEFLDAISNFLVVLSHPGVDDKKMRPNCNWIKFIQELAEEFSLDFGKIYTKAY